jgi:hypothetical protein
MSGEMDKKKKMSFLEWIETPKGNEAYERMCVEMSKEIKKAKESFLKEWVKKK